MTEEVDLDDSAKALIAQLEAENAPDSAKARQALSEERDCLIAQLEAENAPEMTPEQAAASDEIYCVVCKHPIPGFRARRQTATCSEKCKNKLDVIRERQRAAKKCPACLHPSTPEEREEFRIWRAERGDIRSVARVVRDSTLPQKRAIAQILRKALAALVEEKDYLTAQLEAANAPDGLVAPGTVTLRDAQAIAERVEVFTTLTIEAESVLPPKSQPA